MLILTVLVRLCMCSASCLFKGNIRRHPLRKAGLGTRWADVLA